MAVSANDAGSAADICLAAVPIDYEEMYYGDSNYKE